MNQTLAAWLLLAEWRAHPWRVLLSIGAIAAGVALGFAVHLVNASAIHEFGAALGAISGDADFEIVARSNAGFAETVYPAIAMLPEVDVAAPMIESRVAVRSSTVVLDIVGIDPFSAARINPLVATASGSGASALRILDDSAILVSREALRRLGKSTGDSIEVMVDGAPVTLHIIAALASSNAELAMMDIGAAQWRLDRVGRLSRIGLRKHKGTSDAALRAAVLPLLPTAATLVAPADRDQRTDQLSRAYRFNLDMLALMALFTGGFLVYSTQSLSVMRRRQEIALLRVIGASRMQMLGQILVEGTLLGVAGSVLGLVVGACAAIGVLRVFGPDLGGGYFAEQRASLFFAPGAAGVFFMLGLLAALAGSWFPARLIERVAPADSLKARDDIVDPRIRPGIRAAVLLGAAALVLLMAPAIDGLPIAGSIAIGLLLFAGIAAMPLLVRIVIGAVLPRVVDGWLPVSMALKRLWGAPTQSTVALCGIVASVSLMVSMAVMVASFRGSVDDWVVQILPADLYLHVDSPVDSVGLDAPLQARLADLPDVGSVDFLKVVPLVLAADKASVSLLARDYAGDRPKGLPVISEDAAGRGAGVPVWISEAMRDLYGWQTGDIRQLPLADQGGHARDVSVRVRGVWRDYARQTGAIVMRAADYTAATGDMARSDAAITLRTGVEPSAATKSIMALLPEALLTRSTLTSPGEIRSRSLAIFDRSFSITYLLEAVAICIGLAGVAATFSAQTIARAREFGMLRHLGVSRAEVLEMLASEGLLLGLIGVAAGFALGMLQGQILIRVVNPQSFHWSMQTHLPLGLLASIALAMLVASAGVAVLSGRGALAVSALRAVREDW